MPPTMHSPLPCHAHPLSCMPRSAMHAPFCHAHAPLHRIFDTHWWKHYFVAGSNKIQPNPRVFEFSHNYTKLAMLSFLYCFVVKGKFIWAKSLPPVRFEPTTPTPLYFHPNAYPSVLDPQVLIEGFLTWLLFVHHWLFDLEELRGFS